jgi:putative membrane protein
MLAYRHLLAAHIFANMVWIGSITAVGLMLTRSEHFPLQQRARLALLPYRWVAVPAFLLSLIFGSACLLVDPSRSLLRIPSMHLKLTLAVGVIALHHWVGVVARRRASGLGQTALPVLGLLLLLVFAGAASWLGVVKPF